MVAEPDTDPSGGIGPQDGLSRHRLGRGVIVTVVSTILTGVLVGSSIIAYQLGYEAGASRVTPIIMASDEPTKVRPIDPGGMKIPNQDKRIYDQLGNGKRVVADKGQERLVGSGERPIESLLLTVRPAMVAPNESPVNGAEPGSEGVLPPKPHLSPPPPEMKTPPRPPSGPVVIKELAPRPRTRAEGPARAVEPGPPTPETKVASPLAAPAVGPAAPERGSPRATPPKGMSAPGPARKAASGGYLVQLSSAKTMQNARQSWINLQRRHPELVRGLSESIARTDLGAGKGVWFRLRAGPFASREAAQRMCRRASTRKVACFVVRR